MGARLTILQKGLILIAVPLVVQLAFVGLLIVVQRQNAEASRRSYQTSAVIVESHRVLTTLVEAQNALRGFVLLGERRLDEVFQEARRGAMVQFDRLQQLVAGDAVDDARVRAVRADAAELLDWLEGTASLTRSGERDAAIARIAKRGVEPVRRGIDGLLEDARREDAIRRQTVATTETRALWLIGGATLAAIFTTAALAFVFSRDIGGRLSAVADNARRLAAGQPLRPPLEGSDEIARVDRAFREMHEALRNAAEQQRVHQEMLLRNASDLATINRELRHRNEENEVFVYSVSHDLRAPLVNLQGFSQELRAARTELQRIIDTADVPADVKARVHALLQEDMAEALHYISTAVSRLGTNIDALLRLSRIGRVEYRPALLDIAAIVARVVESLQATIAERGATVIVKDLAPCWGDPTAVEQVFANLLDNAVKYLGSARSGLIEVGNVAADPVPAEGIALQTYYVRDNGPGIAAADQAKVFLPFQRVHGDNVPGEGIGLATVRRIVERHGGRVAVESAPGAGSTFFVSLPAGPDGIRGTATAGVMAGTQPR